MTEKYCPICKRTYGGDLNFCLDDGSLLLIFGEHSGEEEPPTVKISDATTEEVSQMLLAARERVQEPVDDSPVEFDGQLTFHLNKYEQSTGDSESHTDSKIILRHSEFHYQSEDHIFEELILHENYEQLWRSLIRAKGG